MKSYQNILIVRTDRIGDVILTTPAIFALRKAYPNAKISILVTPITRDLIEGHPALYEVIVDDRFGQHKGFFGFWRLTRELKKRKFDLAIVYHTKRRANSLCFFSGIPERVGYHNEKFGFMLTQRILDTRHEGKKHEAEYCLDVLRYCGILAEYQGLYITVKNEAEKWARNWVESFHLADDQFLIAIHPGASDPAKQWPVENFGELIKILIKKYPGKIVLVGADNARAIAEKIIAAVPSDVIDLTGKTSLGQLVALLKNCRFLVSNDSGPVHVADAVSTPVISIFTRNQPGINPERWRPLGKKSIALYPPKGSFEIISVSEVLTSIEKIINAS